MEPSDPKPTEAQQRIKTQNGKKSDQADRVGVDLASSKLGSIAQPLPNLTALAEPNSPCRTERGSRGGLPFESRIHRIASANKKTYRRKTRR